MANTPEELALLEQQVQALRQKLQATCRRWEEFLTIHSVQVQASLDMFLLATPDQRQQLRDFVVANLPPEQVADALAFLEAPPAGMTQVNQFLPSGSAASGAGTPTDAAPSARFPHTRMAGRI